MVLSRKRQNPNIVICAQVLSKLAPPNRVRTSGLSLRSKTNRSLVLLCALCGTPANPLVSRVERSVSRFVGKMPGYKFPRLVIWCAHHTKSTAAITLHPYRRATIRTSGIAYSLNYAIFILVILVIKRTRIRYYFARN